MIAVLFPGQGSQAKGMGAEEFDRFPELVQQADEILGYSVRELCLQNPHDRLVQTQYTQVALYVVNALKYLSWIEDGNRADMLAGHSLGEYDALFAAGTFTFATGLRLVQRRGELMSKARGGGMAAVVGISAEEVAEILQENGLETIDVANLNTPRQTVISGLLADVEASEPVFSARPGCNFVKLKVSGAFHSRYMKASAEEFSTFVSQFRFAPVRIPIISNAWARPYQSDAVARTLVEQIHSPVRWAESIVHMMDAGVDEFVHVGPGRVTTDMVKQIKRLLTTAAR